jgi:ArsR family transcriptional regulator, lead/cadmium/zinc/bismuth-responsive transcriptional repressor
MMKPASLPEHAGCGDHPAPQARARSSEEAVERAAALFRAAGDVARLRLLDHLSGGEACVSELAATFDTKMSTLSQQLRVLLAERVVARRREGKHIFYRLADDHVRELVRAALDHAGEVHHPRAARSPTRKEDRS